MYKNFKEYTKEAERQEEIKNRPTPKTCWRCGEPHTGINTYERSYCSDCFEKHQEEDEQLMNEYLKAKIKVMWRRAVNNLEKQNLQMNDYYEEAKFVLDLALEDYNKFQSSPEMMAAIQLLKQRVKAKVQYKVGRYRVDFLLPELKVVLEIDGKLHDYKVKKDSKRDAAILNELNAEDTGWEVIRIPVKHIDQNVSKLVPAIKALYKEKQRLRRKHGGFIPTYFSKHAATSQLVATEGFEDEEDDMSKGFAEERLNNWEPEEL